MKPSGFTSFTTAIGHCAVAWSAIGITGLQLPEATLADTLARLRRRFPEAREADPPQEVRDAIRAITTLLTGARTDLAAVAVDFTDTPAWERSVYEVARTIGPGETLTYGEIAARLGDPAKARDVGQAMARNPWPIVVPCHRVTAADGKVGGFSARGGVKTKLRLLAIESVHAASSLPLFRDSSAPSVPRVS